MIVSLRNVIEVPLRWQALVCQQIQKWRVGAFEGAGGSIIWGLEGGGEGSFLLNQQKNILHKTESASPLHLKTCFRKVIYIGTV